ncbi:unnamed protein product [Linum tenue]|uniref:PORR domain-containing protein n=1 Tax=Linum tenue TaxID=586396 RepID=A0AAV0R651_9ROSI|nr:unnamed protein product [Linum tenue]
MRLLCRRIPEPCRPGQHHRTLVDFAAIKHVRDRGFDHAVEREMHLKPLLQLKNFIKSEPAKSLPLPLISQHKDSLQIPTRPIEFIRKYPSVFEEFHPGGLGIHPHIKLTQQVLDLDAEEQLVYQSESYRQNVADRLVKLVMLARIDKIPLNVLDCIKWDLGLPDDYVKSIVPEFPDYFRVLGPEMALELVCWCDESAVSVMEKKAKSGGKVYEKGKPLSFEMQFSTGFEMDKKVKKWFDEWQKLPYISPYENATHLGSTTDEADKWAAGVLHELLNLFVSKKADKEDLLYVGEWLGIRSWFKRALLNHPGIFYVSGKLGTYTVVLKEGYKRGWLAEKNELVDIRSRYMHLMHLVPEGHHKATTNAPARNKKEEKKASKQPGEKDDNREKDAAASKVSDLDDDSDDEDAYEDDDEEEEDDDDEEVADKNRGRGNAEIKRGRAGDVRNNDVRGPSRSPRRGRSDDRPYRKSMDVRAEYSKRTETRRNLDTSGPRRERSVDRPYRKSMDAGAEDSRRTETRRSMDMRGPSSGPRRERSVDRPYRKRMDMRAEDSRRTETRRNSDVRERSRDSRREHSDEKPYRKSANEARSDHSQTSGPRTRSNFRGNTGKRADSPKNMKKSVTDESIAS